MKPMPLERQELLARMRYWPPEVREAAVRAFCAKHDLFIRYYWVRDPMARFGLFTVGVVLKLVVPDAPELSVETGVLRRLPRRGLRVALTQEVTAPT